MTKPVIAAVRGYAVGGGFELALYCDLIVAAFDARFALPETGLGVIAGQGGIQRLIGLAGRALAADLILTRSEEHTSELQSLMRISYAVFCLKKKKHATTSNISTPSL